MKDVAAYTTVDEYIQSFDGEIKSRLQAVRAIIRKKAPQAVEGISYGMPAYKLNGKPFVYFAGYQHHLGFYATPTGHEAFKEELSKYKQGKGSVQFPLDEPLPVELIEKIVDFRSRGNKVT